jgi:hypothetical protein
VHEVAELPVPTWVRIEPDGDAFLLLHLDENGESFADTWHQTIEDAKAQAAFEFEIAEHDWQPAS